MTTLAALLAALPQILKLISFFLEQVKDTPAEQRREILASFDKAIEKAKKENSLVELSKWFGGKI